MKQLVVLSGKGGTGKTSVVASLVTLAFETDGPLVAADGDVEAANLGLLLRGNDERELPFVSGRRAHIDPATCMDCGSCQESCRFGAVRQSTPFEIDPLLCEGCGVCAWLCPADAIDFTDNQAGWLLERTTRTGPLSHARLGLAQDSSGKLVAAVRQRARVLAEEQHLELVVVDGPPGIGCPVHAALTGCDLAVVVTEPTASGEHDLARVLELVDHFRMKAAVVINKYDLAPAVTTRIETMVAARSSPIVGRIPFDRRVPAELARGALPLEVDSFSAALRPAWATLRVLLDLPGTGDTTGGTGRPVVASSHGTLDRGFGSVGTR